jgi:uncharacterized membrane protein
MEDIKTFIFGFFPFIYAIWRANILYKEYKENNGWEENSKSGSHMRLARIIAAVILSIAFMYLGIFGYPGLYVYG